MGYNTTTASSYDSHIQKYLSNKRLTDNTNNNQSASFFDKTDSKGNKVNGYGMAVANTAIDAFGAYTSWQSLQEAKKNNAQTREMNIINSENAAKSYNSSIEERERSRRTVGGSSRDEINTYLNSAEFDKKKARSL